LDASKVERLVLKTRSTIRGHDFIETALTMDDAARVG
jgi:hypothetical protein